MPGVLETAGERLLFDSELSWVGELVAEGSAGALLPAAPAEPAPVRIVVERSREPFAVGHGRLLARGVHAVGRAVVIENVCSAGFDLHVDCDEERADLTYRWRPPARDRLLAHALRARFHLLARAALVQYPALWWAGRRGHVPLHASGCLRGGVRSLVVAAGGVGRSTLLLRELAAGGASTGDNLAVGDGTTVWGLVEPLRVEGAGGRRMYHGRRELPGRNRLESLEPDNLVVLERSPGHTSGLRPCDPLEAARALATSTYMAGELRRYWGFAATLAAATRFGPAHPPIADVAAAFASRLPCFTLQLGAAPVPGLLEAFRREEAPSWA